MTPARDTTFRLSFRCALAVVLLAPATHAARADNPTAAENRKSGTPSWELTNAGDPAPCPATPCGSNSGARRAIEGYASHTSYVSGDTLRIYVSCDDTAYQMRIYRVGWYFGEGARLQFGPVTRAGKRQLAPAPEPSTGLVECDWTDPFKLRVPSSWTSGVYLAVLESSQAHAQNYVIFVVREDARRSDLLVTLSTNTDQAYNCWGGKSLYGFNSTNCQPAVKVSYNRPYMQSYGAAGFFFYEIQLVRWLEREGYDVTYATNVDLHADTTLLRNHRALLSTAHDEYWTWEMRHQVDVAPDTMSTAFLGGAASVWQVRLEPDRQGRPLRTLVGYKQQALTRDPFALDLDPANDRRITTQWRSTPVNHPEARMIGVQFDDLLNADIPMTQDLVVTGSPAWAFTATGAGAGDHWFGLLGHECDRRFPDSPGWIQVLAHSPVVIDDAFRGYSDMTVFERRRGIVFAAGTLQWSWALDDYAGTIPHPGMVNLAAQQLMRNVLHRMLHPAPATIGVPDALPAGAFRAWPQPYRGGTLHLTWDLPVSARAMGVVLVDVNGRRLRTLSAPEARSAPLRWDGRDDHGRDVPSGIVFLHARAAGIERILKLIVMR